MATGGRTTAGIEHRNGSKVASREDERFETAYLAPWQEAVGNFESAVVEGLSMRIGLRTKAGPIQLILECTSPEGDETRDFLADCPKGSLVGILRTDLDSTPILLRRIRD